MYDLVANYKTLKFDLIDDKGMIVSDVANLLLPIDIIGSIEESNRNMVLLRTHENKNGIACTREFQIAMNDLASQADFHTALFRNLYLISYKLVNHLRQFLMEEMQELQRQGKIKYKHKTLGFYHDIDGKLLFLLDSNQTAQGLSEYYNEKLTFTEGSKSDYEEFLKREILPYKHMQLALALGLSSVTASYLEEVADTGTIVVNLCGASSTGKSTTAQFIASLWGDPHIGNDSLVRTFNSTQGAMFASIEGFKGVPIILDDATTAGYLNKTQLIYQLSQGEARSRLTDYGRAVQQGEKWSGVAFITSEMPILSESETRQGLIARVIETNDIIWTEDAEHSIRIKNHIQTNYGYLGKDFAQRILGLERQDIIDWYQKSKIEILNSITTKDNLTERIVNKLAIVLLTAKLVSAHFKYELNLNDIRSTLVDFDQVDVGERHIAIKALETIKDYIQKNHRNFDKFDEKGVILQTSSGSLMGIMTYHKDTVDVAIPATNVKEILMSNRIFEYRAVIKY